MITEGYVVRHYQGRSGGRGPALIDIAQDHLLFRLADQGLFDLGIALKGGTAVRKFWAGSAGRFSTDLDFAGSTMQPPSWCSRPSTVPGLDPSASRPSPSTARCASPC